MRYGLFVDRLTIQHVEYLASQNKPNIGVEMARGRLRETEVPHLRAQVREIMATMDPEGHGGRVTKATRRGVYTLPFVNSL
jgi:hypothetical protein